MKEHLPACLLAPSTETITCTPCIHLVTPALFHSTHESWALLEQVCQTPLVLKSVWTAHTYFCRVCHNAHCLFSSSGTSSAATNMSWNVALIFQEEWNNIPSKLTIPPSTLVCDTWSIWYIIHHMIWHNPRRYSNCVFLPSLVNGAWKNAESQANSWPSDALQARPLKIYLVEQGNLPAVKHLLMFMLKLIACSPYCWKQFALANQISIFHKTPGIILNTWFRKIRAL